MTRLWRGGEPITVVLAADAPQQFIWRGRRQTVTRILNRWRIDSRWWDLHVWREYFKLTTQGGWIVVVYRDLNSGGWFLMRLYD